MEPCKKRKLATLTKANEVAKLMEAKHHSLFKGYFCEECNAYHVTHRVSKLLREHFLKKFVER